MTDRLVRVDEIAEMTGKPVDTIRWYRHRQTAGHDEGPRMFKLGRSVVAKESDVREWINRQYGEGGNPEPSGHQWRLLAWSDGMETFDCSHCDLQYKVIAIAQVSR